MSLLALFAVGWTEAHRHGAIFAYRAVTPHHRSARKKTGPLKLGIFGLLLTVVGASSAAADITVGDRSVGCAEDPACINRLHPDIPMAARAELGQRIVFNARDAFDLTLDPAELSSAESKPHVSTRTTQPAMRSPACAFRMPVFPVS